MNFLIHYLKKYDKSSRDFKKYDESNQVNVKLIEPASQVNSLHSKLTAALVFFVHVTTIYFVWLFKSIKEEEQEEKQYFLAKQRYERYVRKQENKKRKDEQKEKIKASQAISPEEKAAIEKKIKDREAAEAKRAKEMTKENAETNLILRIMLLGNVYILH